MAKYTLKEREELAAAGKRLGLGVQGNKVAILRERTKRANPRAPGATKEAKRPVKQRETASEHKERMLEAFKLTPLHSVATLDEYDVTNPTRYPAVAMPDAGKPMLDAIFRRYRFVMGDHKVTPIAFKSWREHFMIMTAEQIAALLRVNARTVRNWENGKSPIPFSVWWVMHVTMQDPEYFLTRPGFHDFYIDYVDGIAYLCSYKHPEIRYSPNDLYVNRCALDEVLRLRASIGRQDEQIRELVAENVRLRQMLKSEGVAAELKAMRDHIGQLMEKLHTADVIAFESIAVPGEDVLTKRTGT